MAFGLRAYLLSATAQDVLREGGGGHLHSLLNLCWQAFLQCLWYFGVASRVRHLAGVFVRICVVNGIWNILFNARGHLARKVSTKEEE